MTEDALLPAFADIGTSQHYQTNRRGRRTEKYETYQMNEQDIKNIKFSIKKHYFKNPTATLADTFSWMLGNYYSYLDGNGKSDNKPLGERPSDHQFRQVVKRSFPLALILRKRKGKKDFNRDHNQHLTGALYDAIGAGHIYEIDATIADVWLVAKANPKNIIGKPTMYLIYDRWSRLCVGFYVGLESASWESAMQAILSIAEDKQALCRKHDIPYDPSDYPADGIFPSKFLGDCAEMISRNSNRICEGMEGTIINASPLSPQTKGTVECGFRLTHVRIASVVPGYDPPSNAKRRRGKHFKNDACLTVDQFTSVILLSIRLHNHTLMKNYQASPEVILRTRPVPIELWNDSVITRVGKIQRYSEDYLHLRLLPRSEGKITERGILFKHCYYSCPELEKKGWFIAAANRGRSDVSVSFDRRLVDTIVAYDPNDGKLAYRCKLTKRSECYKGYSFPEVEYVIRKLKEVIADDEQDNQQRRSDFRKDTSAITVPAHAAMKVATKGRSRSSRTADTASERSAEKTARRQTEAAMPNIGGEDQDVAGCEASGSSSSVVAVPSETKQFDASNGNRKVSSSVDPGSYPHDKNVENVPKPISIEKRLALKRQELQREFQK
ncbi:transcriptional antiterminator [Paraburkholderia youngii]|uniref:Transcriptional antiterminator n=1 Tax=Paraburkholderia youngii TaxID=2782701 RepID=A0A7Y6MWB7_9BURK|nr:transcriptional antiterminator [Paraburkholderia youngii]NUX99537.1 transcriptional antiterminator [Paraburkholderia youngii]